MKHLDLLDELLVALASLPAHLPCDLIKVFASYSPRGACLRCQLKPSKGRFSACNCQIEAELQGMEGLASAPSLMGVTLVVRARGSEEDGFVFVRVGFKACHELSGSPLGPFVDTQGAHDEGNPAARGIWSRGELRSSLVDSILREAVACGCRTIAYKGSGRYVRTDTGQELTGPSLAFMFADE